MYIIYSAPPIIILHFNIPHDFMADVQNWCIFIKMLTTHVCEKLGQTIIKYN